MKTVFALLLSASGLVFAPPGSAQMISGNYAGSSDGQVQMQIRIGRGVENGVISNGEARMLKAELGALRQLDARYSRAGYSNSERRELIRRGDLLGRQLYSALRTGGRYEDDDRLGDGDASLDPWANRTGTLARDNRGDRFDGDFQIGQRASVELIALPPQYRSSYRDDAHSYFQYNQGRVYQIDRSTDLILRMLDPRG